jgi:hypothetical protein
VQLLGKADSGPFAMSAFLRLDQSSSFFTDHYCGTLTTNEVVHIQNLVGSYSSCDCGDSVRLVCWKLPRAEADHRRSLLWFSHSMKIRFLPRSPLFQSLNGVSVSPGNVGYYSTQNWRRRCAVIFAKVHGQRDDGARAGVPA